MHGSWVEFLKALAGKKSCKTLISVEKTQVIVKKYKNTFNCQGFYEIKSRMVRKSLLDTSSSDLNMVTSITLESICYEYKARSLGRVKITASSLGDRSSLLQDHEGHQRPFRCVHISWLLRFLFLRDLQELHFFLLFLDNHKRTPSLFQVCVFCSLQHPIYMIFFHTRRQVKDLKTCRVHKCLGQLISWLKATYLIFVQLWLHCQLVYHITVE